MITPYKEVNHNASVLMGELVLMIAVIILILFLISRYSANNMARPIISLSKLMDTYHDLMIKPSIPVRFPPTKSARTKLAKCTVLMNS